MLWFIGRGGLSYCVLLHNNINVHGDNNEEEESRMITLDEL
jgi:hypothetical protein